MPPDGTCNDKSLTATWPANRLVTDSTLTLGVDTCDSPSLAGPPRPEAPQHSMWMPTGDPALGHPRRSVVFAPETRQVPSIAQRNEAQREAQPDRQPGRPQRWPAEPFAEYRQRGTRAGGRGVDLLLQHDRHARQQHVARQAAADRGGHAEQDRD